jgi:hypothetical protein
MIMGYTESMTIQQTVEIPASHRVYLDLPPEIPEGTVRLELTIKSATEDEEMAVLKAYLEANSPKSLEETIGEAEVRAAAPNRRPFSRHFGSVPGAFGGDGLAYQREIRAEWERSPEISD